ncbi:hypothetical protein [Dyadobacter arcticus]|uniref:Aminoglycoside phosphotransferase domain-containing protein n=1 Tax=Dyadobacter arcticus TaxID=1078754 RepID=A0ABX0UR04_9BACT|nr:hypothetical protein [Dyadobacter arcticus]NIJ55428.1 hypothetical protein [Dyadobacter arcticus]
MNRIIRVFHYEDNPSTQLDVDSYFISMNAELQRYGISFHYVPFGDTLPMEKDLRTSPPDILILDMYDSNNRQVGEHVLEKIKSLGLNIEVLVYTTGSLSSGLIDYDELHDRYAYIGPILKSVRASELKRQVRRIALSKFLTTELFSYDVDDIGLEANIQSLGKSSVRDLVFQIKQKLDYQDELSLESFQSGLSGAVNFRLKFRDRSFILKISKDKPSLKTEIHNASELYLRFPARFRTNIAPIYYENEEILGVLVEEVKSSETLFKWLQKNPDNDKIDFFLNELYFRNGLKDHFIANNAAPEKFYFIFEKFSFSGFNLVQTAISELKPILDAFPHDFDPVQLRNFIVGGSFRTLGKQDSSGVITKKPLVLSHGDFHARNILVQGNRPTLIDTGGIKYDYWCNDICRLIAYLFIVGLDHGCYEYHDISYLTQQYLTGKRIVDRMMIELDGRNDGTIQGINWLIVNVDTIYPNYFSLWEFNLGFMKELLQLSYKTNSIPAHKRALALFVAYYSLQRSEQDFSQLIRS